MEWRNDAPHGHLSKNKGKATESAGPAGRLPEPGVGINQVVSQNGLVWEKSG